MKMFLYKNVNTTAKRAAQPAIPMGFINKLLKNPNFYDEPEEVLAEVSES